MTYYRSNGRAISDLRKDTAISLKNEELTRRAAVRLTALVEAVESRKL